MRNKTYNTINNLSSKLNRKTENMITDAIVGGVYISPTTTIKDFRDGWLGFGAIQMQNIVTNNFAIFGSGIGGTTVGP